MSRNRPDYPSEDEVTGPLSLRGNSTRELWQNDGVHDDQHRPSGVCFMYARILARFWYVICVLVIITVGAFTAVSFTLYNAPDFADPTQGFEARGTVITSRFRGLSNLVSESEELLINTRAAEDSQSRAKRQVNNMDPESGIQLCYTIDYWYNFVATVVFEGVNGRNMLTVEAVKSVCEAEERLVTSHPLYKENCLCPNSSKNRSCPDTWSIGNHIAMLSNKTSCAEIVDEDISRTMDLLVHCAPSVYNKTRADLQMAIPGTVPDECMQHNFAVHTILYYILPSKFSENIRDKVTPLVSSITAVFFPILGNNRDALETIYKENIMTQSNTDGITTLKGVDFSIKYRLFASLLFADCLYLGIGVGVIFLLIWVYTGSFLVTVTALLNMIFSLVLGYFFFRAIFMRPFFPFGNFMAVVLIIGVGADDTFVYMDLWKKCKKESTNDDLPLIVYETLRHATVTMFVTSATTAAALFATVISDITVVKCFAVFAGTAIMMNLVLTLTLLPAVIVMQHKLTIWCCPSKNTTHKTDSKCTRCWNNLLKPLKLFYEYVIPLLVLKLRYAFIVIFTLLMAGGAVVVFYFPGFQLPTQNEFQFFADSHHFEQFDFVYKDQFSYTREQSIDVDGCIVWGVQAVDNGDSWNPDDTGTLVLDDSFQFSEPEDQTWLLNFCTEIRNQSFFKTDSTMRCFIEDFVDIMQKECVNPYTGEDASPCCNQTDFPFAPTLFNTCLAELASKQFFPELFFRKNDSTLAVIKITFPTIYQTSFNYSTNNELWTTVNTWAEERIKSAPGSLQQGWFVAQFYGLLFYDLQQSLASGTKISMVITLAIASGILLLSIQNVLITIWAMLTITSAVFVTVASLVLLGWKLNIVEATIITLAVGLSVDFTIHYGVAYKLSPSTERIERTRYSIITMVSAITIAALSTFIAGALVLPATVLIYYQFGVFLMLVISISWSHGTFFFQSLCMSFGPQESCGDIPCLPCCECCRLGTRPTKGITPEPEHGPASPQTNDNPVATNIYSGEQLPTISISNDLHRSVSTGQNRRSISYGNHRFPQGQNHMPVSHEQNHMFYAN